MAHRKAVDTPFLDIAEAAAFLKIEPSTLYAWIHKKKKKLPVRYHGRRVVFVADELKGWSDTQNKAQARA